MLWLAFGCVPHAHASIPAGEASLSIDIDGTPIEVYTYKPAAYTNGALLVVLHGVSRNAADYRRYAKPLADRYGYLLAAPLFDRRRFPAWRYSAGGIVRLDADRKPVELQPVNAWTGQILLKLIEGVRLAEARTELPYLMLGHSAGAQALVRFSALVPNRAQRIVIANPSSWLFPGREQTFPYGFGGLPEELADDAAIRRYLAQPLTILLGTDDKLADSLDTRTGAMRQGENRYARGINAYRAAQAIAQQHGWPCNWQLLEASGVGHHAQRMFASPAAYQALATQP